MYLFIAEDAYYYTKKAMKQLCAKYKLAKIIPINAGATLEDGVRQYLEMLAKDHKYFGRVALMSPIDISTTHPAFSKSAFFEKVYLRNFYGVSTVFQHSRNISAEKVLSEKFGVKFVKPKVTLKDYGGAERLMKEVNEILLKERYGLPVQGFLVAGIPGAGKSFFAECLAGQLNRFMIELNLAKFLEYEQPIMMVDNFFEFIANSEDNYVIRIDEIEKMLKGEKIKSVFGRLLTHISGFGANSKSKVFFVATANNLSELMKEHPEIARSGRFDYLLYLTFPNEDNAKKIYHLYIEKMNRKLREEIVEKMYHDAKKEQLRKTADPKSIRGIVYTMANDGVSLEETKKKIDFNFNIDNAIHKSLMLYRDKCVVKNRYVYTPVEISYVVTRIFVNRILSGESEESIVEEAVRKIQPIQYTLSSSIDNLEGKAKDFRKI